MIYCHILFIVYSPSTLGYQWMHMWCIFISLHIGYNVSIKYFVYDIFVSVATAMLPIQFPPASLPAELILKSPTRFRSQGRILWLVALSWPMSSTAACCWCPSPATWQGLPWAPGCMALWRIMFLLSASSWLTSSFFVCVLRWVIAFVPRPSMHLVLAVAGHDVLLDMLVWLWVWLW